MRTYTAVLHTPSLSAEGVSPWATLQLTAALHSQAAQEWPVRRHMVLTPRCTPAPAASRSPPARPGTAARSGCPARLLGRGNGLAGVPVGQGTAPPAARPQRVLGLRARFPSNTLELDIVLNLPSANTCVWGKDGRDSSNCHWRHCKLFVQGPVCLDNVLRRWQWAQAGPDWSQ